MPPRRASSIKGPRADAENNWRVGQEKKKKKNGRTPGRAGVDVGGRHFTTRLTRKPDSNCVCNHLKIDPHEKERKEGKNKND